MTQLYNKNTTEFFIKEFLDHEHSELSALFLIDIDHFKDVNDSFGHLTGDYVITSVASLLKEFFWNSGKVGRFGGDEFLVLIHDASGRDKLLAQLEEFKKQVSQITLGADGSYSITVSCGVLFLEDAKNKSYEGLFSLTDMALYKAKSNGRNQIIVAT